MNEHGWDSMSDKDFDAMLERDVSELPPDDIAAGVTPWKKAMKRILFGLALCTVTIELAGLNYILPAIGIVLQLLGFRALRRENGWFLSCFVIAIIRAASFFSDIILNTTIHRSAIVPQDVGSVVTVATVVLLIIELICFWQGLRAVKRKAGLPPTAGAAFALAVWYSIVGLLAFAEFEGPIVVLVFLVAYIFIIVNLFKLSKVLHEAGYAVKPGIVRVTDLAVVIIIAAVVIVGCAAGYIFGGCYDMNWQPEEATVTDKTQEIRAHLIDLGFPEDVLNDLTEEDIAACAGAQDLLVDVKDGPENGDEKWDMRITNIAMQLSGEQDKWIIIHHFVWNSNPGFIGTEALQLWPAYQYSQTEASIKGDFTGRVLYDKDGRTYTAPYYWIGQKTYTSASIFDTGETRKEPFAAFSMPSDGERCRGYIAYSMVAKETPNDDPQSFTCGMLYTHQWDWLQYPARTAVEHRMLVSDFTDGVFFTMYDVLNFYPTPNGIETLG